MIETWQLALAVVGLMIAIMPGAMWIGLKIGTLTQSTAGAHARIDRLEAMLTDEFRELRHTLKESVEEGWRHCPLAQSEDKHGGDR